MKLLKVTLILVLLLNLSCSKESALAVFESGHFAIGISEKGFVHSLKDVRSDTDYISKDTIAPLLSLKINSKVELPIAAGLEDSIMVITFTNNRLAKINIQEKVTHITFELIELSNSQDVELVIWGPIPNTISKTIGETVGVVRGDEFALGIQSLNQKTLGGYPWKTNDAMPQFNIFEQDDFSDLSEENKGYTLYRVEAAKPEKFGSTLQAYCRNRYEERIVANLNHDRYTSPIYEDGGVIGSKIALFGCPVEETLQTIGKIEIAENLPHPTIDGKWGKEAVSASAAYLIMDFGEATIEDAISFTKKAGLDYLYHPGPFKNWGHFELNEKEFPNGWDGLKSCVEKAAAQGIHVGVHTLSNFITTNDPYVTPVPDNRLAKVGASVLTETIDAIQTEIPMASPDFFNQYKNNNLHTVKIGKELIRYKKVTEEAPWKLLGCERGAWNTTPEKHNEGKAIAKLTDHAYKVFLSNPELSIEIAEKLAELYNYCGLRQISFDGLEGNHSTGMGNYGENLFTTAWWNALSGKIKQHAIIDASRTSHYFWHIYTRMNWGEPWYAGFRESQTEYRLKNQPYFQRNLMPAMLGWFSMQTNTPIEDIEWMLARSAGFDAGYAFVASKEKLDGNGQSQEILKAIGRWEKARMARVFSKEQKEKMKDINNEFHLETIAPNKWLLHEVASFKFKHQDKVRQPGEPLFSKFEFENNTDKAKMNFILTAKDASISKVKIELNNSSEYIFPVELSKGQSVRYSGGDMAGIFDTSLNKVGEFKINPEIFEIDQGIQILIFDCEFSEKKDEPIAALEIRILDKGEPIGMDL